MRNSDARLRLLRSKIDAVVDQLLEDGRDDVIDGLDHYLLATLRQPTVDILVYDKVTYYVNNVIVNYCPRFKW